MVKWIECTYLVRLLFPDQSKCLTPQFDFHSYTHNSSKCKISSLNCGWRVLKRFTTLSILREFLYSASGICFSHPTLVLTIMWCICTCVPVCVCSSRRPEECETNDNNKKIKLRQNTVVVSCFLWSGIPKCLSTFPAALALLSPSISN